MASATTRQLNAAKNQAKCLEWSVPRWSTARDLRRALPLVFGMRPILRVVCISGAASAAICVCVKIAFPQMPLAALWNSAVAIPAAFVLVGVCLLIQLIVPTRINITDKGISWLNGASSWHVKLRGITSSRLLIYSPDHIRLIIRVKGKARRLAVRPTVDLERLLTLIGSTVVFDKRVQFQAVRKSLHSRTATQKHRLRLLKRPYCGGDCATGPEDEK